MAFAADRSCSPRQPNSRTRPNRNRQNLLGQFLFYLKLRTSSEESVFPAVDRKPSSSFQLAWGALDGVFLQLSGSFPVYCPDGNPDSIVALLLAVDDQIVNVIYWHKPGEGGRELPFKERRFPVRRDILERSSRDTPSGVYVVYAPTEDFVGFCDEYQRWHDDFARIDRVEIGRIRLRE